MDCTAVDGSGDAKWKGPFPWTRELQQLNHTYFGNKSFRMQQVGRARFGGGEVHQMRAGGMGTRD